MRKPHLIFSITALLMFVSAACTRPASVAPVPEPTVEDPIGDIFSQTSTQQAELAESSKAPEEAVATPVEVVQPAVQPVAPQSDPRDDDDEEDTPKFDATVPNNYTLKKGEFPFCLARRFNISVAALLSANGLTLNSVVSPGQKLTIPQNAAEFANGQRSLSPHPTEYTAVSGDTFFSIACKFGDVYPEEIALANSKGENYTPKVGEKLQIP